MPTRCLLIFTSLFAALALAACGGSSDEGTTAAATTASASGAPCTKAALEAGLGKDDDGNQIKVLSFKCDAGWASGPDLFGQGTDNEIEAAFLLKDESGTWVVPNPLPCDDKSIPPAILNRSPCKVS